MATANGFNRLEALGVRKLADGPEGIRLVLTGKMTANGIGDLRREIEEARRHRRPVYLDMAEVTLLDRVSAEYLNSVAGPALRFENCPAYLQPWISGLRR